MIYCCVAAWQCVLASIPKYSFSQKHMRLAQFRWKNVYSRIESKNVQQISRYNLLWIYIFNFMGYRDTAN